MTKKRIYMTTQQITFRERSIFATAWVITKREIRDSLRDWRIMTPIILLTLVFPFLMNFTSRAATNWIDEFAGSNRMVIERFNPFLLMIVGFFPISFSLVIALESFVGEKERNSLEPILSMPVTDLELYLGKMFSSVTIPLLASYLGIAVFLISRAMTSPPWYPPLELTILVFFLTTMEALVMVAGAVVISSQATTVRAANLLASFIIIPMAFLVQAESIVMFYAQYEVLWWLVAGLFVVNLILVRMGIRTFNREEILSKELDELNLGTIWRDFKGYFLRPPELAADRKNLVATQFSLRRIYRHDLPQLLRGQGLPLAMVGLMIVAAMWLGASYAHQYPLPAKALPLDQITQDTFKNVQKVQLLNRVNTGFIFMNNVRVMVLSGVASLFSFGSLALLLALMNATLVSFLITQVIMLGYNPWLFIVTFILPHGMLEIPAIMLGFAFALRIGAGLVSPPEGFDVGQGLLLTTANFLKMLIFLLIPMLLVAAFIEANLTPQIVVAVYGN